MFYQQLVVLALQPVSYTHLDVYKRQDLLHAAAQLLENLNSAFLGNLGHSLDKLLALHGVYLRNAVEVLRRKGGDAAVLKFAAGRDQCVANGKKDVYKRQVQCRQRYGHYQDQW